MTDILNFIAQTILGELLVVIIGVLFAYLIKDRLDAWRYGRWRVRVLQNGQEQVNRPVSPRKAEAVLNEPADLAVFLKGVASPYGWIKVDIVSQGEAIGLLTIDRDSRLLTIDMDQNPQPDPDEDDLQAASGKRQAPAALTLLNFAHPLTAEQQQQLAALSDRPIAHSHDLLPQVDQTQPLADQAAALLERVPLDAAAWQTTPLLVNPPGYAPLATAVLAQIHGRTGHFPTLLRIRPVPGATPTRYEVAELVNLQGSRDAARQTRRSEGSSS